MSCVYLMVLVVVVWSSTSVFGKFRSTEVEVKFEEVILYAHAVFRFCSVEVIITSFTAVSYPTRLGFSGTGRNERRQT
jgi:hypothetical protein